MSAALVADLLARLEETVIVDGRTQRRGRSHTRVVHELRFAGVPWVWYSGPAPTNPEPGYTYLPGLTTTHPYKARFDAVAGYVASGGVKVNIRRTKDHKNERRAGNRADALLREPDGTDYTRLVATVQGDLEAPFDMALESVDGLAERMGDYIAGRVVVWIGLEAFVADAIDAENRTIHVVERGAWGSMPRSHLVDAARSWAPQVYHDPCTWWDRPATLSRSLQVGRRRHGGAIDRAVGYVASPPTRDAQTDEVSVVVTPWSARLEVKMGGRQNSTARLQPGWKVFHASDAGRAFVVDQIYGRGEAWSSQFKRFDDFDPEREENHLHDLPGGAVDAHRDIFDKDAAGSLNGRLNTSGGPRGFSVEGYPGDDQIALTILDAEIGNRRIADNATARVRRSFDLADSPHAIAGVDGAVAAPWPAAIVSLINTTGRPGSAKAADAAPGHAPAFVDLSLSPHRLDADGNQAPALLCRATASAQLQGPVVELAFEPGRVMYGLDMAAPDDEGDWRFVQGRFVNDSRRPSDRRLRITARKGDGRPQSVVPLRRIAQGGWWDQQRWIHVDRGDIWPGAPFYVEAKGKDGDAELAMTILCNAVYPASDIFGPDVPGFLLEVDPRDALRKRPFADWEVGQIELRPTPAWDQVPIVEVLLQVLTSTDGRLVNGPYDRLANGPGVPIDQVDVESFLRFEVPGGIAGNLRGLRLESSRKIREVFGPLLRLIGAQVVMRFDPTTGRRRITLERAGVVFIEEAQTEVYDGEWRAPNMPGDDRGLKTITSVRYKANYVDDKPAVDVYIPNRDLQMERGGRGTELTEELRGIRIAGVAIATHEAALRASAASLFARAGRPQLLVKGRIPSTSALRLDAGSTVIIHSATSHSPTGELGIDGLPGRVVEIVDDPESQACELTVQVMRGGPKPIAPSLEIDEVIDPFTVEVKANRYSPPVNSRSGAAQVDLDWFRDGQRVRFKRRWRDQPDTLGRIVSRDRDTLRLVADTPHNINPLQAGVKGWVILPRVADADPVDQLRWVTFADREAKVLAGQIAATLYA